MDQTFICGIHGTAFRRSVGDDGGPEWHCPIIHAKDEPIVFKPPTIRLLRPWTVVQELADGAWYRNAPAAMTVIVSGQVVEGKRWLHVSASRPARIPSYDDMAWVKAKFVGEKAYAYSVWPPADMHVNIHPTCLHLWSCLDGPVLPEFSDIVPGLGRSI